MNKNSNLKTEQNIKINLNEKINYSNEKSNNLTEKSNNSKIQKTDLIGDVLAKYREKVIPVFFEYGFHCIGCMVANIETIEQGAMAHGFSSEKIKELVLALNKSVSKK